MTTGLNAYLLLKNQKSYAGQAGSLTAVQRLINSGLGKIVCKKILLTTGDDEQPLDKQYSISDFADSAIAEAKNDVEWFIYRTSQDLLDSEMTPNQVGHDFWLTRNGHGAGFWDRDLQELGERLTKICKEFSEVDPYVGDDGKIYF